METKSEAISLTIEVTRVSGISLHLVPRPGSSTGMTSTSSGRCRFQDLKIVEEPPAYGRQNKRSLALLFDTDKDCDVTIATLQRFEERHYSPRFCGTEKRGSCTVCAAGFLIEGSAGF